MSAMEGGVAGITKSLPEGMRCPVCTHVVPTTKEDEMIYLMKHVDGGAPWAMVRRYRYITYVT